jgi:general secretion pathway protein I
MLNKNHGFTLIEVLIALAILSIALTAIIKSTSQNIRDTTYIQNKNIANWVGSQVINEVRAGILVLPTPPDNLEQTTEMLGQSWRWQANLIATPNPQIMEIHVAVFKKSSDAKLISLVSYLYAAK